MHKTCPCSDDEITRIIQFNLLSGERQIEEEIGRMQGAKNVLRIIAISVSNFRKFFPSSEAAVNQ